MVDRVVVERPGQQLRAVGTEAVEQARGEHAGEGARAVGERGGGAQLVRAPGQQQVAIEPRRGRRRWWRRCARSTVRITSPLGAGKPVGRRPRGPRRRAATCRAHAADPDAGACQPLPSHNRKVPESLGQEDWRVTRALAATPSAVIRATASTGGERAAAPRCDGLATVHHVRHEGWARCLQPASPHAWPLPQVAAGFQPRIISRAFVPATARCCRARSR